MKNAPTKRPAKKTADKRNKVCTAIGKSLKSHRIAANKSQEALAFEAEVDRTFISQCERGVGNPSALTLASVCYALGITLAELFADVNVSLKPDGKRRRANQAKPPAVQPPKTRYR